MQDFVYVNPSVIKFICVLRKAIKTKSVMFSKIYLLFSRVYVSVRACVCVEFRVCWPSMSSVSSVVCVLCSVVVCVRAEVCLRACVC